MKIAITGHTRGLGKAIFDHLSVSHEVIGMSRENGFDITKPNNVIEVAESCDLFINNAHSGMQQAVLLGALHKKVSIVTSGSMGADYPLGSVYGYHKAQIEKTFRTIIKTSERPMLLLKMGYLENFPYQNFTPFKDVLKAIDFWLDCPRIHVIQFDDGEWHK